MLEIFSPQARYSTWRRIWVALAESQRELGLKISSKQIAAMKRVIDEIDFAAARRYERQTRHDVMAHIHAFAEAAPAARGIIHLGATSMDIVDNADLLLLRNAVGLLFGRLLAVIDKLAPFCERFADLPTLGFTHLQPAQLTTVGKRASLWLADLESSARDLLRVEAAIQCRGLRGATGTQASFLKLLGSPARVIRLEKAFARRLGFDGCMPVCGQTYSRKLDLDVINVLAAFAAGTHKICNDIRLLAMLKEIEEPFDFSQVGSSAMPYKRNPARCERATGLARFLLSLSSSPSMTLAAQMFERTLDDSSNKRLVIPQAFLAADSLCVILHDVFSGLVVYPATIRARIDAELPFIATEDILMEAVSRGGDRQQLHERIRIHSLAAGQQVKRFGRPNDLISRLQSDPVFANFITTAHKSPGRPSTLRFGVQKRARRNSSKAHAFDWNDLLDPARYTGLAPDQTRRYVRGVRDTLLRWFADRIVRPERPTI